MDVLVTTGAHTVDSETSGAHTVDEQTSNHKVSTDGEICTEVQTNENQLSIESNGADIEAKERSDCEGTGSDGLKSGDTESKVKRCQNKSCIKSDIQSEDGLLVCVNCGQVFNRELNQLKSDPTQEYFVNCRADETKSYVSNNKHFPNRFPVSKKYNTSDIERLVANLSLETYVRDEAITKYKHMIATHFRFSSRQTKTILSAICIYITLIASKTAVTIGHICNTIGCNNSEFSRVFNQVIREFPDYRCEGMPIESLVSVTISETNIDFEEKKVLAEKVIQIIELERECWLIEGRAPCHIIFAATYMAWKSYKPYERRKVKLTEFCRTIGIDYKHTTSKRVTELLGAIKKLATKLPKNREIVITQSNIGIYLEEILNYRSSLVYDYNKQRCEQLGFGVNNGCPTSAGSGYHKSSDWSTAFKRNSSQLKASSSATVAGMGGTGGGVESDVEISDTEIECYLRNDREVKFIKKLRKYTRSDEN